MILFEAFQQKIILKISIANEGFKEVEWLQLYYDGYSLLNPNIFISFRKINNLICNKIIKFRCLIDSYKKDIVIMRYRCQATDVLGLECRTVTLSVLTLFIAYGLIFQHLRPCRKRAIFYSDKPSQCFPLRISANT